MLNCPTIFTQCLELSTVVWQSDILQKNLNGSKLFLCLLSHRIYIVQSYQMQFFCQVFHDFNMWAFLIGKQEGTLSILKTMTIKFGI